VPTDHDARVERERAFHDARYADDPRGVTDKYYDVDSGVAAYRSALARTQPGDRVLEYGCGTGSAAFDLSRDGAVVTGIDISPVAIEAATAEAEARGVGDRAQFRAMDAHRLDLPDDGFDLVCGSGVLHHLDLGLALPELARVLAPGGRAVFYEPLGTNPLIRLYRRLTPKLRTPDEHPLVAADLSLAARSFSGVDVEYHTFLALAGAVAGRLPGGRRIVALLQRADRWLFRRVPPTRRLAWTAVIHLTGPR
jgi:SAM-dependent methyltransferase